MKKIGIITLVKVNNYGAELQAFATQIFLQLMGYDAEIIDYLYFINPRHKRTRGSRPCFKFPLKQKAKALLYPWLRRFKHMKQDNAVNKRREDRFNSFHSDNTKFSCEYCTAEALNAAKMDYDVYIVGSDQVWNPYNYTSLDPYFLKFAPQGKTKISYASSFGVSSLPDYSQSYYCDALRQLNSVSVREENAVKLVEDVSGKKAQWVLDPTLLLTGEEWNKFAKQLDGIPEEFVLIYEVTPCSYVKQLALIIAKELGCKVVRINCEASRKEDDNEVINVMDAGPAEFIWLFSKARMVVTNSFHGLAFSLNMQRDFFVVTPERKQNNSRQNSLLRLVGLENRMIIEGGKIPERQNYYVDYSKVNPQLEAARERSKKYLLSAINGE